MRNVSSLSQIVPSSPKRICLISIGQPATCAYRLLYENKPLFDWHPLISGDPNSVKLAHIPIENGIHEKDVIDWFEFVIDDE